MTDTTQPQAGRELRDLDILMAYVNEWAVYETGKHEWSEAEFPCLALHHGGGYTLYMSSDMTKGRDWRPSTDIRHAFEVDREGWSWSYSEGRRFLTMSLIAPDRPMMYSATVHWHEEKDKARAHALGRCRAIAAWWEVQP